MNPDKEALHPKTLNPQATPQARRMTGAPSEASSLRAVMEQWDREEAALGATGVLGFWVVGLGISVFICFGFLGVGNLIIRK